MVMVITVIFSNPVITSNIAKLLLFSETVMVTGKVTNSNISSGMQGLRRIDNSLKLVARLFRAYKHASLLSNALH
jgi:hypothetical protein